MTLKPTTIVVLLIALVAIIVATALFIPQETNPAYAVAINFVNAAGKGEDDTAMSYLSDELKAYIAENCADGRVSVCIDDYTPADWGNFLNGVFRRAQPDGKDAWDILLLATYAENQGFSGVCIYNRVEKQGETWALVRWSGWISCDLPNSGLSDLRQDDAPNRAP